MILGMFLRADPLRENKDELGMGIKLSNLGFSFFY